MIKLPTKMAATEEPDDSLGRRKEKEKEQNSNV